MMRPHRYIPNYHDPLLCGHHKQGKTDGLIGIEMDFSTSTIQFHRTRLKLLPNDSKPKSKSEKPFKGAAPADRSEEPSYIACAVTAVGATERLGAYWFPDGQVATTEQLVKRYNRIRKRDGKPQIGPEKWREP